MLFGQAPLLRNVVFIYKYLSLNKKLISCCSNLVIITIVLTCGLVLYIVYISISIL
jgi:hypothetical protein